MPTARERLRLVASGRYLYAIGGFGLAGQSLSTVERYDPVSDSWRTTSPMHETRAVPCAVETMVGRQSVIVVVAGVEFSADGIFVQGRRTTEVFDPDTGRWVMLDALLRIVRGSNDCAVGPEGTVITIGGGTDPPRSLANVDALSIKPRDLSEP